MVYPYDHKWHYFLLSVGWVIVQCTYPIFFIHSSTYEHLSCFHIVVLEKTLESPSDWKEIKLEYSLEGLMLKLKVPYSGHLMRRGDWLEKTLMLGKSEGKRTRGRQRIWWLDGITDSMDMGLSKFQETVENRETWHTAVHRVTKSWPWCRGWTATKMLFLYLGPCE